MTAKKLLLIDDDPRQLEDYAQAMRHLGFEVAPLLMGPDMLIGAVYAAIRRHKPDAILTDWQINNYVSGTDIGRMVPDACERLDLAPLPVILHSTDGDTVQNRGSRWKNEYSLLGAVEKGRHEEINRLFTEWFDTHQLSAGESDDRHPDNTGRGR